jgi:zinc/manganese transport system permease protein
MVWLLANPLLGPLIEFQFMRSAMFGCIALSLSAAPVASF